MSNCPLCNSRYNNNDDGDELFLLHLTNFHGMQDDNAQDILGRSMESKANEGAVSVYNVFNTDSKSSAQSLWNSEQDKERDQYGSNPYSGSISNMHSDIKWLTYGYSDDEFNSDNDVIKYIWSNTGKRDTAGIIWRGKSYIGGWAPESKASEDITFADPYYEDGYDENGYDRDGYDRYGYDKDGYGKDGVDHYRIDSGYYPDRKKRGESKSNEVDFETMHNAEKWWDKEFVPFGSKTWENQNIAERRTTINAYLRRKQNAWGEKYIDEKHTGMTHYVDYGFTDNEWNLFSEDTKNALRIQLRKNNESIANEWDCESCGGEYSNCPNCYEGVHDWEWEKENDVCPHCGKNRFGDEVNQLQTEEGMCKSCVDNFLSKAMEKYDNSGYDEDGYDEYGRDYDGKLKPSKNMTDLERSKDELLD